MTKVMILILHKDSLLICNEIISLLDHEIDQRVFLCEFPQLISPENESHYKKYGEEVTTEDGKALNSRFREVRI